MLFDLYTFSVHFINDGWNNTRLVSSKVLTISSKRFARLSLNLSTCKNRFNIKLHDISIKDSFWRHVVLHNNRWIQRIQIKADHVIMNSNMRFFYKATWIITFGLVFNKWYCNFICKQSTIDNRIPYCSCSKRIVIVYATFVCYSHAKSNKSHLIFDAIYQFYVFDIIVDKLLKVVFVQRMK